MAFTERSRASREAVLAAARRTFAERGYERTTVRVVAAAAGVDPSMVIRYFGSKDGLFAAAVQVDLGLPDLTSVPVAERGDVLARHFLHLWEGPETGEVLVVLLRSATTNDAAAAGLRAVFAGQVVALVAELDRVDQAGAVGRAGVGGAGVGGTEVGGTEVGGAEVGGADVKVGGAAVGGAGDVDGSGVGGSGVGDVDGSGVGGSGEADAARADVARRAGLIATQVLGTALTRYVLRLPPVVALTREEVVEALAPNLQSLLDPAPARQ